MFPVMKCSVLKLFRTRLVQEIYSELSLPTLKSSKISLHKKLQKTCTFDTDVDTPVRVSVYSFQVVRV